jgi:hypothetical protein
MVKIALNKELVNPRKQYSFSNTEYSVIYLKTAAYLYLAVIFMFFFIGLRFFFKKEMQTRFLAHSLCETF